MATPLFTEQKFSREQIDHEVNVQRENSPVIAQMLQQLLDTNDELMGKLESARAYIKANRPLRSL